jgi:hypothetical protein
MAYSDILDPSAHFQAVTYTGTGPNQDIVNDGPSDLKPDLVWIKNRTNGSYGVVVFDSSRGVYKLLYLNTAYGDDAEGVDTGQSTVQSFNTNGFRGASSTNVYVHLWINATSNNYVAWQWKANGGTYTTTPNGTQTTNNMQMATKHQINSDAGFSICTYQGATSYGSFYHGLGVKPDVVMIKSRNAYDWVMYHSALGYTHTVYPHTSGAGDTGTAFFSAEPDTTQVYCKDHNSVFRPLGADKYIAYCWTEVKGYSKFGKYIGNANDDGPFVYTGFKPAYVIMKRTDASGNWVNIDNKRDTNNVVKHRMFQNLTNADNTTRNYIDFYSNGFKMRNTDADHNASAATIIYMAWAENPFVAGGVPATAR